MPEMPEPLNPTGSSFTYNLTLPDSSDAIGFNLELVPVEALTPDFDKVTSNVARVSVGGRDFYAVMGRTAVTAET